MSLLALDDVVTPDVGPLTLAVDPGGETLAPEAVADAAIGVVRPVRGRVRLFGQALEDLADDEVRALRTDLVLIGRDPVFVGHLDVQENLALPLRYHRRSRGAERDVRAALAANGLTALATVRPHALTPAQRRAVARVRALLLKPRLLLLVSDDTDLERRLCEDVLARSGGVVYLRAGAS